MDGYVFSGLTLLIIGVLALALAVVLTILVMLLLASRDLRIEDLGHERDAYREIAEEAVQAAEVAVNKLRAARGQEAIPGIPPVVPEHSSPITRKQQETADLQTVRARMAVVARELGLPPRVAAAPGEGGNQ